MVRLALASLFTLGLMAALLFSILLAAGYALGYVDAYVMFGLTALAFFFFWLVGPFISDFIYQWFYGLQWIGLEGLGEKSGKTAQTIKRLCEKNRIKTPKIGFIPDDNPQAFTYGSDHWNARLVLTKGIFTYLNDDEASAVAAHEVGHIVHKDFIVMTVASFIVTILYELYHVFLRSRREGDGERKGNVLMIVGAVSFVFYVIASYLLLFLSRIREYYADEFSGEETSASDLSRALTKIAYGIIAAPDTRKTTVLMESTRHLGIFDFKIAKHFGLNYLPFQKTGSLKAVENAIVYDLNSPWAFLIELGSSHPLTGKRLANLARQAADRKEKPFIDLKKIASVPVDKNRLWRNFIVDLAASKAGLIGGILFGLAGLLTGYLYSVAAGVLGLVGGFLIGFGAGTFVYTLYRYPGGVFGKTTIVERIADIYASPVRGTPVEFEGKITGRGVPGLIFSEDMMFEDKTGIIYLDYQHLIPVFGNLFFAWTKVDKLVGANVKVLGWQFRGMGQWIVLDRITNEETIKSRQRLHGFIAAGLWIAFGIIAIALTLRL